MNEDDPPPNLTGAPVAGRVAEGQSPGWRVTLSEAASDDLYVFLSFQQPVSGPELSTVDVPADWAREAMIVDPEVERTLSAAEGYLLVVVPAGETSFDVTVPTVDDGRAEGEERIRLVADPLADEPLPQPVELTGSVVDG